MKSVAQHYADVVGLADKVPAVSDSETVPLAEARGRVLATDILARFAVPPFSNSAMDGFAVRVADLQIGKQLPVVGDIVAGDTHQYELAPGTAIRIMTGAPLPAGTDAVLPVEDTENWANNMLFEPPATIIPTALVGQKENLRFAGADLEVGDRVLDEGTRLGPAHLGSLASVGYGQVPVKRRVKVGVLGTGEELCAPGEPLKFGQIPDSNSWVVRALAEQTGADVQVRSVYSDQGADFIEALDELVDECDLIITTGGVSAGAWDVVKIELRKRGVEFAQVAMQPGKPQGWGVIGDTAVVCLPGNPVSVFVSMHLFALPLLRRMCGENIKPFDKYFDRAVAGVSWSHKVGRTQFLPAVMGESGVEPATAGGSGSHLIGTLPTATFIALTPADQERVEPGEEVTIIRLPTLFI